ncbi:stalk domain-containing protein [Paenibacillus lutrae]|uniref:Copper amine oxidase N-terminal domain-containing protein n=1 Tax=Paenibacillus lutrae TaxID=2078573 RepID=A0A7X3FLJ1_9BACL|nr:stalk domain-containing protein [Paenibacillus lutrae]MVP01860.1 copper amine oxidase N-terminal domain-containing protein [Paenibacillus lutrae]
MKWKQLIVIGSCSLAFGATCYAAGSVESIQAYINHSIKITVNGLGWTPLDKEGSELPPVIIDGHSYLPAHAVVKALDGQVQWNEATKTIAITSSGTNQSPAPGSEETERDQQILTRINALKEKLHIGITQDEVRAFIQEEVKIVQDNGDSENGADAFWKYDFFKKAGYHSDLPDQIVDEEGLVNHDLGVSLFIAWKDKKLLLYTISYVNPVNNKVYLFAMNPDGTISDGPVSR